MIERFVKYCLLLAFMAVAATGFVSSSTEAVEAGAISPFELIGKATKALDEAKNIDIEALVEFDVTLRPDLTVQYTGALKAVISRPNKFFFDFKDNREEKKIWFDGNKVTYLDVLTNHFAGVAGSGPIVQTASGLFQKYGLVLPISRLILGNARSEITKAGAAMTYLGKVSMASGSVHHVAVHGGAVDMQLWIDAGEKPVLRKITIVDRSQPLAPRYTVVLNKLSHPKEISDKVFSPVLPDGATETVLQPVKR